MTPRKVLLGIKPLGQFMRDQGSSQADAAEIERRIAALATALWRGPRKDAAASNG